MASLIKSISLKNFKGFSEEVRIDIRPITLLFGANSAGKSSILHALHYLREILERNNTNPDRTQQGGTAIDLGGFLNLVHGRSQDREIEIEIGLELGDESIPELVPDAYDEWVGTNELNDFYNTLYEIRRKVNHVSVRLTVAWNELRQTAVVVGYQVGVNGVWCARFEASSDGRDVKMRMNQENPIFLRQQTPEESELEAEIASLLEDWVEADDLATNDLPRSESSSELKWLSVLPELFSVVREAGLERPGKGLRAWLTGLNGAMPRLGQMLNIPAPDIRGAENIYTAREFTAFLSWLTIGPAMLLRDQLQKALYIGPVRSIPSRSFEASLSKNDSAWSDGMAAWEALTCASQNSVDQCSDWMKRADRLNTGYGLVRTKVQELDLATGTPLGRPKTRITLVDKNDLRHQPLDVGVGISQVLPVVVAALTGNASIVSIEQPELHVHPEVQVGLGDLFIQGAWEFGTSFLIETHSEHLILRLLRRVRETSEGNMPADHFSLAPDDLNIVYIGRSETGAVTIDPIAIDDKGKFLERWPRGFFPERMRESLPTEVRARMESIRQGE